MEREEQRSSSNPSAMFAAILSKRAKLHEELRSIEKQVYDMETTYLQGSTQWGNVSKGYETYLSSTKSTTHLKKSRKFGPEDRVFSLSSVTSRASEELAAAREAGPLMPNGQGKPKRGRGGPRDSRRTKHSSEPDYDYDDDPDVTF